MHFLRCALARIHNPNRIMQHMKDLNLLTREDVAEIFKVSPMTVKRWQHRGQLPAIILGHKTVRYRTADVQKLIERHGVGVG